MEQQQQQAGQQGPMGRMAQLVRKTTGPAGLLGDQPPEVRAAAVRAVGRMPESWCAAMLLCEDDELRAVLLQEARGGCMRSCSGTALALSPSRSTRVVAPNQLTMHGQRLQHHQCEWLRMPSPDVVLVQTPVHARCSPCSASSPAAAALRLLHEAPATHPHLHLG